MALTSIPAITNSFLGSFYQAKRILHPGAFAAAAHDLTRRLLGYIWAFGVISYLLKRFFFCIGNLFCGARNPAAADHCRFKAVFSEVANHYGGDVVLPSF